MSFTFTYFSDANPDVIELVETERGNFEPGSQVVITSKPTKGGVIQCIYHVPLQSIYAKVGDYKLVADVLLTSPNKVYQIEIDKLSLAVTN